MTTATSEQVVPVGTWAIDKVHSTIGFAVKHMVVSTFRGAFDDYDVSLSSDENGARLAGAVRVASVDVKDENLEAHLQSPDFFDAEQHPELRFESSDLTRDGDDVVVRGDLTIRGVTHPVEARGTVTGPHTDFQDNERLGIELETVIDRTAYGLEWNAPLPKGGFALANDVKLAINLEFTEEA
jgi:polyisoprenoid-binding protein YceI